MGKNVPTKFLRSHVKKRHSSTKCDINIPIAIRRTYIYFSVVFLFLFLFFLISVQTISVQLLFKREARFYLVPFFFSNDRQSDMQTSSGTCELFFKASFLFFLLFKYTMQTQIEIRVAPSVRR